MKAVFIFPPVWSKKSPSTGISAISGYLKNFGYDTEIFDLNIDFYIQTVTDENYDSAYNYINNLNSRSFEKNEMLNMFNRNKNIYDKIKGRINESVKIVTSEQFYELRKYKIASFVISKAIELISLKYYPLVIFDEKIENLNQEMQYNDFKKEALNKKNIFYEFLKQKSGEIAEKSPDYAGISINFEGQMTAGLTMANILKSEYKLNTCLGGTHITRIFENIKNDIDLFNNYADYAMIGAGEIPTLKLMQMLGGKCKIEEVPGIIYKKENKIKCTNIYNQVSHFDGCSAPTSECSQLLATHVPDGAFSAEAGVITTPYYYQDFNYTLNKQYFLPEKVYPVNISKGCYWGKCKFCDFNMQYSQKPVENVIEEIKFLVKNYNARYFYLTDAALAPKTAKEFAGLLLKENLDIRYTTFLRFEKVYDKKFLNLLYKSGCRCVSWGLESASQKVLNLMNKGTDINVIQRILNDTAKIGIANRLTIIYLFPGETFDDFCKTINFLKKNQKKIFFLSFHRYMLKRYSYVFNNMEEFGIHLNTNEIKSEYHAFELGIPYNQSDYDKKLHELSSLKGGIYQLPDEVLLYYSNFEKSSNKYIPALIKSVKGKI